MKDFTGERASRFDFLISRRPVIRFLYCVSVAAPVRARAVICVLFASAVSARRADFGKENPITVEKYLNEIKQIDLLWPTLASKGFKRWKLKVAPARSLFYFTKLALANPAEAHRAGRIAIKLCDRYPLFVAMRASETIFSYMHSRRVFREMRPKVIVSSSDGNPYGRAMMAAAHAEGIPLVFVSHGPIAETPVRAKAALAVLHGVFAMEDHSRRGSEVRDFLLFGHRREGAAKKIKQVRRVLICLGGAPELENLRVIAAEIVDRFPAAEICVRPHPHAKVGSANLSKHARKSGWKISSSPSIDCELSGCDFAVAGSSTVHLDCLTAGVPSLFAPSLDSPGVQPLSFIRAGLLVDWADAKTMDDINAYSSRPGQREMLSRYMSQESSREEFIHEFGRRIDGLLQEDVKV